MPLIDSVIQTVVRERGNDFLIVQELKGEDRYRFQSKEALAYIENEILDIRVTGLNRTVEIGRLSELLGVVVSSEISPDKLNIPPIRIEEDGIWDPTTQYGPATAAHFFPSHIGKKVRRIAFRFEASPEFLNEYQTFTDLANLPESERAQVENPFAPIGRMIQLQPNHLHPYNALGRIFIEIKAGNIALKYYEMSRKIGEMSLPPDSEDYILSDDDWDNRLYLDALIANGDLLGLMGRKDEAIELYRRYFKHTPTDFHGARFRLKELTKEDFPLSGPKDPPNIEPYDHLKSFSVPLHDRYYPDAKPSEEQWLRWHPNYKAMMIMAAHEQPSKDDDLEQVSMHIQLHLIGEDALASNSPEGVRLYMARLVASGLSRHEALHHVGKMVYDEMRKQYQKDHEHEHGPGCGCEHDDEESESMPEAGDHDEHAGEETD